MCKFPTPRLYLTKCQVRGYMEELIILFLILLMIAVILRM